jgi:hypothetical protein
LGGDNESGERTLDGEVVFIADPEAVAGEAEGALGVVPDVDDDLRPGDGVVVVLAVFSAVATVGDGERPVGKAIAVFGTDAHPEAGLHGEACLPLLALEGDGGFGGGEGSPGDVQVGQGDHGGDDGGEETEERTEGEGVGVSAAMPRVEKQEGESDTKERKGEKSDEEAEPELGYNHAGQHTVRGHAGSRCWGPD